MDRCHTLAVRAHCLHGASVGFEVDSDDVRDTEFVSDGQALDSHNGVDVMWIWNVAIANC